jgi:hypothetical protein
LIVRGLKNKMQEMCMLEDRMNFNV